MNNYTSKEDICQVLFAKTANNNAHSLTFSDSFTNVLEMFVDLWYNRLNNILYAEVIV
jgi:hypothetical protein